MIDYINAPKRYHQFLIDVEPRLNGSRARGMHAAVAVGFAEYRCDHLTTVPNLVVFGDDVRVCVCE